MKTSFRWLAHHPIEAHPAMVNLGRGCHVFYQIPYNNSQAIILLKSFKFLGSELLKVVVRPFDQVTGEWIHTDSKFWDLLSKEVGHAISLSSESVSSFSKSIPRGSQSTPIGTFYINLNLEIEKLWKRLHSKHRNVIRKSQSLGVVIDKGSHCLDDSFNVYKASQERSGNSSISKSQYSDLYHKLSPNVEIYVAYYDEEPVAGCFIPFSTRNAIYLYGGVANSKPTGVSNLMHWEVLKDLKKQGVGMFDFFGVRPNSPKGSKYEGLYRYKERFGGELVEGFMWTLIFSPVRYNLYKGLRNFLLNFRRSLNG